MYTIDTNAVLYYLHNDKLAEPILQKIFSQNIVLYISVMTELELFSLPTLSDDESGQIENVLKTVFIVPVDSNIARIAGSLRRQYKLKTPDSAIAATAFLTGTQLVTRNIRDFQKIPDLQILKI